LDFVLRTSDAELPSLEPVTPVQLGGSDAGKLSSDAMTTMSLLALHPVPVLAGCFADTIFDYVFGHVVYTFFGRIAPDGCAPWMRAAIRFSCVP
jgi:hypothetical protein